VSFIAGFLSARSDGDDPHSREPRRRLLRNCSGVTWVRPATISRWWRRPNTPATTRPELAEIALGLMAVRSASGAASERATNEPGHAVTRWMITLARLDQSARALGDPSAALPVATAALARSSRPRMPSMSNFASGILFGDQVLDQFAPGTGPPVGAEREPGPCS